MRPYQRQTPARLVSLGSGVIIDPEGYVLTNNHVVQRANKIWVKCSTNDTPYEADLIASNPRSDVASLIKLRAQPGERFTTVALRERTTISCWGKPSLALGIIPSGWPVLSAAAS